MNNEYKVKAQNKINVRDLVMSSLLVALVFIATRFINIRIPISINGGLIHLGTAMLFIVAFLFGKGKAAIAGAVGMFIFDIVSGWGAWAPFTFVVRGVMGYLVGTIAFLNNKNGNNVALNLLAIVIGSVWMIAGYYLTEGLLYGNWLAPVTSIPGNLTQIVVGAIISIPVTIAVKKTKML